MISHLFLSCSILFLMSFSCCTDGIETTINLKNAAETGLIKIPINQKSDSIGVLRTFHLILPDYENGIYSAQMSLIEVNHKIFRETFCEICGDPTSGRDRRGWLDMGIIERTSGIRQVAQICFCNGMGCAWRDEPTSRTWRRRQSRPRKRPHSVRLRRGWCRARASHKLDGSERHMGRVAASARLVRYVRVGDVRADDCWLRLVGDDMETDTHVVLMVSCARFILCRLLLASAIPTNKRSRLTRQKACWLPYKGVFDEAVPWLVRLLLCGYVTVAVWRLYWYSK